MSKTIKKLLSLAIATFMTLSVTACSFDGLDLLNGNGGFDGNGYDGIYESVY